MENKIYYNIWDTWNRKWVASIFKIMGTEYFQNSLRPFPLTLHQVIDWLRLNWGYNMPYTSSVEAINTLIYGRELIVKECATPDLSWLDRIERAEHAMKFL